MKVFLQPQLGLMYLADAFIQSNIEGDLNLGTPDLQSNAELLPRYTHHVCHHGKDVVHLSGGL